MATQKESRSGRRHPVAEWPTLQARAGWAGRSANCERQIFELTILGFDLPVKVDKPASDSDPGQQFLGVEWLVR